MNCCPELRRNCPKRKTAQNWTARRSPNTKICANQALYAAPICTSAAQDEDSRTARLTQNWKDAARREIKQKLLPKAEVEREIERERSPKTAEKAGSNRNSGSKRR